MLVRDLEQLLREISGNTRIARGPDQGRFSEGLATERAPLICFYSPLEQLPLFLSCVCTRQKAIELASIRT
jgi:hypothetical protein